jgi:hypothetical protein
MEFWRHEGRWHVEMDAYEWALLGAFRRAHLLPDKVLRTFVKFADHRIPAADRIDGTIVMQMKGGTTRYPPAACQWLRRHFRCLSATEDFDWAAIRKRLQRIVPLRRFFPWETVDEVLVALYREQRSHDRLEAIELRRRQRHEEQTCRSDIMQGEGDDRHESGEAEEP